MGRKPFDGKETEVIRKLEEAFMMGCSDTEACLFANISKTCLYEYQERNPKFAERKAELKENPILIARKSVLKSLPNDSELALKFLERRKSDEFAPKQKHEIGGDKDNPNPINIKVIKTYNPIKSK